MSRWTCSASSPPCPLRRRRFHGDGPRVQIIEHQGHAPGYAALFIKERGGLVAGDMLSDVLVPMLDLTGTADPIEDYLAALGLLEGVAGSMSSSPVTGQSVELSRYTHGSSGIGRTCWPCVRAMIPVIRG